MAESGAVGERRASFNLSFEPIIALALAGLAAYVLATTLRAVVLSFSALPFYDQWQHISLDKLLTDLLRQHNEHRIPFLRLILALDWVAGAGRNVIGLVGTGLVQVLHALLLARVARRDMPSGWTHALGAGGVALGLLSSLVQWSNFTSAFHFVFISVFAAATSAFALIAFSPTPLAAVLAFLMAVIASLNMANGVAVAPLLSLMALLMGRPRAHVIALAVGSAAIALLYLHGYETPGGHTHPSDALRQPWSIVQYVAAYLGAPFAPRSGPNARPIAVGAGAVLLVANLWLGSWVLARRRRSSPACWTLLATSAFIFGTAFITALGRISVNQALESRYTTPALIAWCVALLHLYVIPGPRSTARRLAVAVAALGLLTVTARRQREFFELTDAHGQKMHTAETALLADAPDRAALRRVIWDPPLLLAGAEQLRRAGRSIFADGWARWLGRPLASHVKLVDPARCAGELEEFARVEAVTGQAYRASGWAYLTDERRRPSRVVLADERGLVVGYGRTGLRRRDVRAADRRVQSPRTGWIGHAGALVRPDGMLRAYALLDGETAACPLEGSARAVP